MMMKPSPNTFHNATDLVYLLWPSAHWRHHGLLIHFWSSGSRPHVHHGTDSFPFPPVLVQGHHCFRVGLLPADHKYMRIVHYRNDRNLSCSSSIENLYQNKITSLRTIHLFSI